MASTKLLITPIQGYTAEDRAQAISAELFSISRPPKVRQPQDVSAYLFGWIKHPEKDLAVLQADTSYIINVHPENDLTNLQSLFPELSETEKTALAQFIHTSQSFQFGAIIPQGATTLTDEQLIEQGFVTPEQI